MSNDPLIRIVDDFIAAFNESRWEGFRAPLASAVRYEESGTGRVVDGVDPYVELVQGWRVAFPDVMGAPRRAIRQDNTVAQEIVWEGTQTGPLLTAAGELPPSNRKVSVPATLWYTFEGEHIQEIHHHLDIMTMMHQLGALPA